MEPLSRRERVFYPLTVALIGLIFVLLPLFLKGGGVEIKEPFAQLIESFGIALTLVGSVSFGVEQLLRRETRNELVLLVEKFINTTKDIILNKLNDHEEKILEGMDNKFAKNIENVCDRIGEINQQLSHGNIEGIYATRETGIHKMANAIKQSNEFVYIMGISLRQFFGRDPSNVLVEGLSSFYRKFENLPNSEDILSDKFRILIIDNGSQGALERSNLEQNTTYHDPNNKGYKINTLYIETEETRNNINKFYPKLSLRTYEYQSLFLVLTDHKAFLEPYHFSEPFYRNELRTNQPVKLAEHIPLMEFRKSDEKGTYDQLLGHFNYIFKNSKFIQGIQK